jgi:hypothetical protein
MKTIYELVDEVVEDLGVVELADYLLYNYEEFSKELAREINGQLKLDNFEDKEEP